MQEKIQSAEYLYDQLCEKHNPPLDWEYPDWSEEHRVHNWRNYVNDDLKLEWHNLTGIQKILISSSFECIASNEHWD